MKMNKKIVLNGETYTIRLNEGVTAQAFEKLNHYSTSLAPSGNHCYGPIYERLPIAEQFCTSTPHKGGVYYADYIQSIAIYTKDGGNIEPFVIVEIGEVEEDVTELLQFTGRIEMEVD